MINKIRSLVTLHNFFVIESKSYLGGKFTLKQRLFYPIAYYRFMRDSLNDI